MKLFDKIFGKEKSKENTQPEQSEFDYQNKLQCNTLNELINQNTGLSFEKQMIFGDVIGENNWELDLGKGKIFFGTLEFPIQVIGSLSFNDSSWMWGWANKKSGIPENLLTQSNELKKLEKRTVSLN